MKICKIDSNRIFTGEQKEHDGKSAIPKSWIAIDPPKDGIMQFAGDKWTELKEYPKAPEMVPTSLSVVQKTDLVEALIKAGHADTLEKMLNAAPAEIRQAWYAYQTINLSDERIIAFFSQAKIDLKSLFAR